MDHASSSGERLLDRNTLVEKLYDEDILLDISPSIASGFIALLGGSSSNGKMPTADLNLSFMALTEGNVLDACFGVENASVRRSRDTPAYKQAQKGKNLLGETAFTNEDFKKVAVAGYRDAFEVVMRYNKEMGQLNCFTACFKSKKIRKRAIKNLRVTLLAVAEAIDETS